MPLDLLRRIDAWGAQFPGRIAHRVGGAELSWGELRERSDALAAALHGMLGRSGAPIVVHGHKEPEMLVGFLGCAKAGHPYVPVDLGIPGRRLEQIVAISGAGLVLTPARIAELSVRGGSAPAPPQDPEFPHYLMFTSGSTGQPKGVVITRGCLETFLEWMLTQQRFTPGREVFLNQSVFSFDLSVMDTWCSLASGGTLVSLTHDEIAEFRRLFESLAASAVTTWVSTPPFARLCLAEPRFSAEMLPRLRRFLFCGDVLTAEIARALLDRFPLAEVWNTYGPTEATVATTSIRVDRDLLDRYPTIPIGYPMPGTTIRLEDQAGGLVAPGERGEIVIAGPNVSPGYVGDRQLEPQPFCTREGVRAYRTGDEGFLRDGLLFFAGRQNDQVKIAGNRIELGDVEAHLAALPMVSQAIVVAARRDGRPESLHAFVVLNRRPPGTALSVGAELRQGLADSLPAYMLPRKFHLVETFPLTSHGKVDRQALAALAET